MSSRNRARFAGGHVGMEIKDHALLLNEDVPLSFRPYPALVIALLSRMSSIDLCCCWLVIG